MEDPIFGPAVSTTVVCGQACHNQGLAAMEGRPEQSQKGRVTDELDAFVLVVSAGRHGWKTATPHIVFDRLCFLDT